MVDLCAAQQRRGYDVLAVIGSASGSTAAALRKAGVPFVAAPQRMMGWRRPDLVLAAQRLPVAGTALRYGIGATALLTNALRVAWVLKRRDTDIVHAQSYQSILVGRLAALAARVPIRVSTASAPLHLEVPHMRWISMRTRWIDTVTVAGSEYIDSLHAAAGARPERRAVIRYGADRERFEPARADGAKVRAELGIAPDTPLVGQVAHFYPPPPAWSRPPLLGDRGFKGQEDLIAAAKLVVDERPDARFVLVGGAVTKRGEAYRSSLMALARELGVDHAVRFVDERSDIPDVLAALDVSVQCSLCENYGGTVESLMMGRPTIATRVGGMPETVQHEKTGLLVPPRDPGELAAAILRLLDDRALGARLGAAGRALMLEGFTTQRMCDEVAALYDELLESRCGARRPVRPAQADFQRT
jgi:glycosyltransferase involved in cell wall biosynthesis